MLNRELIDRINAEIDDCNFGAFDQLTEKQQIAVMATWDEEKRLKYLLQNTLTDRQTFEPILGTEVWFEEAYSKAKYPMG